MRAETFPEWYAKWLAMRTAEQKLIDELLCKRIDRDILHGNPSRPEKPVGMM